MAKPEPVSPPLWLPCHMLIGGRLTPGDGQPIVVHNPSNADVTTTFAGASLDQFRAAIAAARTAADTGDWAVLTMSARVATVRDLLARFMSRIEDLRSLIITETGIPIRSFALPAQVDEPLRQM